MEKRKAKISLKEVQRHNHDEDCWIVLRRKVYDVTDFLQDHPAGADILLACAGTDATEAFVKASHSIDAEDMLSEFYVGDLAGRAPRLLSPFDIPSKKHRRPPPAAYQRQGAPAAVEPIETSAMRLAEIMRASTLAMTGADSGATASPEAESGSAPSSWRFGVVDPPEAHDHSNALQ